MSHDTIATVLKHYHSSITGLTEEEAKKKLLEFGPNQLQASKKKPLILQFLEEFKDLMVIILLIATIFAFITGEMVDALIILSIVIINASIGFMQKFKAEKAIEALRKMITPSARVLRDGVQKKIAAQDVVPGDILVLEEGDRISADALVFEENELQAQEAILTGESTPVDKQAYHEKPEHEATPAKEAAIANHHMIFMATTIIHGTGRAVVLKTGMLTEMGKIARLTTETGKDKSPLEKELQNIGYFVGKLTLGISAVLFVIGFLFQKKAFVETLLFATSVAVAAVPEGLPATITIALAIGVQRLVKSNAIVKQLSSVETLGATTVICTDKTGTLTKNEMTVKELYFDKYKAQITGVGYTPAGSVQIEQPDKSYFNIGPSEVTENPSHHLNREHLQQLQAQHPIIHQPLELLMLTAVLCNNADIHEEHDIWKMVGDPTEGALVTVVAKSGFSPEKIRKRYQRIHEYPFDSTRKRMSVLVRDEENDKFYVFSKGSPANQLASCTHVILNNHAIKLDPETHKEFLTKNDEMARHALRSLAFAYHELTPHEVKKLNYVPGEKINARKEEMEQNMTFVGLMGMLDPPRPEVSEAIEVAKDAGIKVYMITGDHGLTAEAIAKQIGLVGDQPYRIILGDELSGIHDSHMRKLLHNKKEDLIFARITPEHKLRIVTLLKELDEVVAVTGDGVNDAPALKRADIGIAMGISGTDVSKEAANMILSDDSFSSIVTAIREGRTIYDNLKKFIFYIFSSNIGELFVIFAAIIFNVPMPLTAVLILFINLTTDVLPAIALGVEPTEPEIMLKKPRSSKDKILNKAFIQRMLLIGSSIGLIIVMMHLWNLSRFGWTYTHPVLSAEDSQKATSMAFVLLTMIQMTNALNSRSEQKSIFRTPFFSNPQLLWAIALSILLTVFIVEVPWFEKYLHTSHLDPFEWLIIATCSFLIIGLEEIRKFKNRQHGPLLDKIYAQKLPSSSKTSH